MKFIGITGGVGAGKSLVLDYLRQQPGVVILQTDLVAKELMEPQGSCYEEIGNLLDSHGIVKEQVMLPDGNWDRKELAKVLFQRDALREELNAIVHPAVKTYVLEQVDFARKQGNVQWFFVEAALLIEEHYDELCDELWYIYASEDTRRIRLAESRGYTEEKSKAIMDRQQSEAVFRTYCKRWINNDGDFEQTKAMIDEVMGIS